MEYRHIVSITGKPGLFQLINTKNNGAVVKSLQNQQISFISARNHQLTPLESIEIYMVDENIRLDEAFTRIKEFDAEVIEANQKNDKKNYRELFETIIPDYDEDRVYVSDIKKVFKWYQLLKENDLLHFEQPEEAQNVAEQAEEAINLSEETDIASK